MISPRFGTRPAKVKTSPPSVSTASSSPGGRSRVPCCSSIASIGMRASARYTAAECVAVEDSPWGLQSARAAGFRTVAVAQTYDILANAGAWPVNDGLPKDMVEWTVNKQVELGTIKADDKPSYEKLVDVSIVQAALAKAGGRLKGDKRWD